MGNTSTGLSFAAVLMFLAGVQFGLNVLDIMSTESNFRTQPDRVYESNPRYYTWGPWLFYAFKIIGSLFIAAVAYATVKFTGFLDSFKNTYSDFFSVSVKTVGFVMLLKNVVFIGAAVVNNIMLQFPG